MHLLLPEFQTVRRSVGLGIKSNPMTLVGPIVYTYNYPALKSMAAPEAGLTSLVYAAVMRLSMFSGPRATDNRIFKLLSSV